MRSRAHLIVVLITLPFNLRNWLLTFVLSSLLAGTVAAQYRFDHWTTSNGLPNDAIHAILQTRNGYLWLATSDGLARFDGVRFTNFHHGNTEGVEGNRFYSLYEDHDGTLWAGSVGIVVRYRDGQFVTFGVKDGVPEDEIYRIEQDVRGQIWLSGLRRQVAQLRDGRFVSYDLSACLPGRIPDWGIRNGVWWSQDQQGLHFFLRGRCFTLTKQDGLPSLNILSTSQDQYGTLWISTDAGLWRMKDPDNAADHFQSGEGGSEDRDGNLWLSKNDRLRCVKDGVAEDFTDLIIIAATFYQDREKTLWIGTTNGLYRVRKLGITALTEKEGLYSNWTYSILQDRTGAVWLGSGGGGVSCYRDGKYTHFFSTGPNGLYSTNITSLYEDRDGVIWIGTNRGMCRFKDSKLGRYSDEHGLDEVWATHQDRAGDFWFATSSGITRLHNGSFTSYATQDGLPSNHVTVILEDRNGALWFGTYGGLALWQNGQFIVRTVADGLSGNRIRSLYEDSDGALWIGTYDSGMTRLKDGHLTRFTTRDGLFGNGVFQILDDERGNFWMSSNQGISRVRWQELNNFADGKIKSILPIAFGLKDGMINAECNGDRQPAGWKMRDGKLWFPTMGGVAKVDPAAIAINPLPPPVVIEECRLNRESKYCRDQLQIEPGEDNLEIQYTANSFIKPEQIRFKYKLLGADPDWVEAGNRRTAFYSHLKPGHYVFTVTAANSDGIWNENGESLKIIAVPYIWQRWWFILLAGAVMVGAIAQIIRHRFDRFRRETVRQQTFARQLIESQEHERHRFASELHDSLSQDLILIHNWAQQGIAQIPEPSPGHQQLTDISARSAQALAEVKEIIYNLRPHLLEEVKLSGAINILFRKASSSSGIGFTAQVAPHADRLSPEIQINLYRITQECVNNIIKHSRATEAKLTISNLDGHLLLTVQDNGCGFDASTMANGKPGNLGLTSIAERARMLGGEYQIQSAPGHGTTITIKLKLQETTDDQ